MPSKLSIQLSAWLARLVCTRPRLIIAGGVLIGLIGIALALTQLRFQPDRNDLLSKDLDWNQRIIDWWASFPHMSDMVVAVDTHAPGADTAATEQRLRAEAFVRALATRLQSNPTIANVDWGAPQASFSPKAARLQPLDEFQRTISQAESAAPFLESRTPTDALEAMIARLSTESGAAGSPDPSLLTGLETLATFVRAIGASLDAPTEAPNPFLELVESADRWSFLESPNGRFLFLRLTPTKILDVLDASAAPIAAVRDALDQTTAEFPGVDAGFTGIDVVESDETEVATIDSTISSILAAALIAALLITAFHGWRKPLFAMLTLIVGIAWTFGYLTLAVGHLQILSVVFVVILLGLGIDFAIHLSTTIEEFRHEHPDGREPFCDVLAQSFQVTGPGMLTGAATTAAAFAATIFTPFRGVAELGIIACGGIILCMIAMLTLYPAMLYLFHHSHRHIRPLTDRTVHVFRAAWLMPIARHPRITFGIALALVVAGAVAGSRIRFSEDLLALQPRGVPSVEWQQRIAEEGNLSIWYAVSINDSIQDARTRRALFVDLPTVSHVGGIGLLFPRDLADKLALIRDALTKIDLAPPQGPPPAIDPEALRAQLGAMRSLLQASTRGANLPQPLADTLGELTSAIEATSNAIASLPDDRRDTALAHMSAQFTGARVQLHDQLAALLDTAPLVPADFPPDTLDAFVDTVSPGAPRYALEVYPKLPDAVTSPLDPRFLDRFMTDVRSVDPNVTGVLPQIYYSNDVIRTSFVRSGAIAIVVVLLIVLFVFRSIVDAALCLMPVVVAFLLTFGLMVVLGMTVNPANIIVLPLLFGIGVDSGVHILHRFRHNPRERPLGLTHGTGKGVTLTSLTTMAGFGAMLVARHRGIQGLGLVLTMGIGFTLLACWTLLPAVLELRRRSHAQTAADRRAARLADRSESETRRSRPASP